MNPYRSFVSLAVAVMVALLANVAVAKPRVIATTPDLAAIARAVIHAPALLIADEPTGNLDTENGLRILQLLSELNRELGLTILLATHSTETAACAERVIHMRDGQIQHITQNTAHAFKPNESPSYALV